MRTLIAGLTSQTIYVKILDSTVTTGAGKTGLAYNTASLIAYYTRVGGSATAITLATQTATGAWSSGGFVEVDATHAPGLYRLDVPDAAIASGVDGVIFSLNGATGMAQCDKEVELVRGRYGLASVGAAAGGGSTTSVTVPAAEKLNIAAGYAMLFPGNGTRYITGYNSSTGVATFSTAFPSDPSGATYLCFVMAPGESSIPVPASMSASERSAIGTALLDLTDGVESGLTLRNALRDMAALLLGEATSQSGATPVFKSLDISAGTVQSTKSRVTGASVDSAGNRGKPVLDHS